MMKTLKASALRGRAVVSPVRAEMIGTVSDILVDPGISRVVGLKIQAGRRGSGAIVRVGEIRCIGADAVVIPDRGVLHDATALPLRALSTGLDLHHTTVMTYSGTLLGRLRDVEFETDHYQITQYLLAETLWEHLARTGKTFRPAPGFLSGADLLLVPDEIAEGLRAGTPTLPV
jgi:uncharacterized protein YrrD